MIHLQYSYLKLHTASWEKHWTESQETQLLFPAFPLSGGVVLGKSADLSGLTYDKRTWLDQIMRNQVREF